MNMKEKLLKVHPLKVKEMKVLDQKLSKLPNDRDLQRKSSKKLTKQGCMQQNWDKLSLKNCLSKFMKE